MDVIVIVNKTDLPQKINIDRVHELATSHKIVTTSLLEEKASMNWKRPSPIYFLQVQ